MRSVHGAARDFRRHRARLRALTQPARTRPAKIGRFNRLAAGSSIANAQSRVVDYFWLMEDLEKVTGLKWLNMPRRTKLFWSIDDHGYRFESWYGTGDVPVPAGEYKVLAWEDGKGKGFLMVFEKSDETPPAVAVESVVIERVEPSATAAEYCVDDKGVRRLVRFSLHKKRMVLPVWEAACRRAHEPGH